VQSKWHIAVPPFSKTDSSALSDATGSDDKQHAMYDVNNDVGDIDLQPLQPRRYASRLSYYSLGVPGYFDAYENSATQRLWTKDDARLARKRW